MRKRTSWGLASIVMLFLIWGNSMLPGSVSSTISSQASQGILSVIYSLIPNLPLDFYSFHSFIRKAAHFGEYALLGICIYQFINTYAIKKSLYYALLICMICACVDEFIQYLTPNRLSKFSDVVLDGIGAFCGMGICRLVTRRREKYASHGCEKNARG